MRARGSHPVLPTPLPCGTLGNVLQRLRGTKKGAGDVLAWGLTAPAVPGDPGPLQGQQGGSKAVAAAGWGQAEAEPSSGCPWDTHQAQGGHPPWGNTLGLKLQSPALLSVGIQRAWGPQELPCVMCRSCASSQPGHGSSRGAVPVPGACARCWLWSCASTLLGMVGTVRCWPGPSVAPPALSPTVPQPPGHSPTHRCLRSRRGCWQREALGSCLPSAWRDRDERAARPLQPSPAVLSHLQSIRSSLKPGQAPASPWEKPERSSRPAGRGKETWPRAIGCSSLCSCAQGCVGGGAGGLGQCQLCPQL